MLEMGLRVVKSESWLLHACSFMTYRMDFQWITVRLYIIEEPLTDLDAVAINDVLITLTYLVYLLTVTHAEKSGCMYHLLHAHTSVLLHRLL